MLTFLILDNFSNTLDIINIPILSAITDNGSTLPTILNAIPIAKTPTAINN